MFLDGLLTRGVAEIIERESLLKKLKSGKKLKIKFGVDPTAPDIHLGIAVGLRKLALFQKLGHKIIFLIGDFTATIGDPSLQDKTRPLLSKEEIEKNARTYLKQAGKILNIKETEIKRNSSWYGKMTFFDLLKLTSQFTLQRVIERDDFQKRLKKGKDIRVSEILYPLMQAYDSVILKSDLEVGGTDQKFNMLTARNLMKKMNLKPQDIMTLKILVGIDGAKKMSKSWGNYVGITDKPEEMYGKIMSIPDEQIIPYFELCTDIPIKEVKKIENPRNQKAKLAHEIVKTYHSEKMAKKAEKEFEKVFKEKGLPSEMPEMEIKKKKISITSLLVKTNLASSKSEAKRLIEQGGVKIKIKNQRSKIKIKNWQKEIEIKKEMVIQVGKRKFVKIK